MATLTESLFEKLIDMDRVIKSRKLDTICFNARNPQTMRTISAEVPNQTARFRNQMRFDLDDKVFPDKKGEKTNFLDFFFFWKKLTFLAVCISAFTS